MKRSIIALCLLLPASSLEAQVSRLLWSGQIDGLKKVSSGPFTKDDFGNTYVTGTFDSTVDFDPGPGVSNMTGRTNSNPNNGPGTIFIEKLDPQGNLVWCRKFDGYTDKNDPYPCAIAVDAAGFIYSSGSFSDTVDFDPGPGEYKLVSPGSHAGGYGTYLSKLDSSGNFVWAKRITEDNSSSRYYIHMMLDPRDHIIVHGYFNGAQDIDPGPGTYNVIGKGQLVLKLDSSANLIWVKQPDQFSIASMTTDKAGNIYWTGLLSDDSFKPPGTYIYPSSFVSKNDSSGINIWTRSYRSLTGAYAVCLAVDDDGSVYSTGHFHGTCDFDPGPGIHNVTTTDREAYLQKLDSSGNFMWVTGTKGFSQGGFVALDSLNNVYFSGIFSDTVSFYADSTQRKFTGKGWLNSTFILKLNSRGDFVLADIFSEVNGIGMVVDKSGGIYATGNFRGTIDVDPSSGTRYLTSLGNYSFFVLKLDGSSAGTIDEGNPGSIQVVGNDVMRVYPKPATAVLSVAFKEEQQNTTIQIMDGMGRIIKSINYSGKNLLIERGGIPDGLYYLRVFNRQQQLALVEKIVFN